LETRLHAKLLGKQEEGQSVSAGGLAFYFF
jgi:hypothetical protein